MVNETGLGVKKLGTDREQSMVVRDKGVKGNFSCTCFFSTLGFQKIRDIGPKIKTGVRKRGNEE